ncbi:hypothetical protein, partial [Listeria monocytogenes]|uniref:hypothetical protein n=1 Tax=Listeria monocytogenes TaxID=1639 RepID=UPI002FDC0D66
NNSGEDFSHAQVRLVVGTINLVENIAHLASGGWRFTDLGSDDKNAVKKDFAGRVQRAELKQATNMAAGASAEIEESVADEREKSVVKEGL